MNKVNKGDIIEDISTNSFVSIGENNMEDKTTDSKTNKTVSKNKTKN